MTPRRLLVAFAVAGILGGAAAPAFAEQPSTRVCVNATHDKNNPGPAFFCVWLPVDAAR
jgi:hypothetical protein